ncbi:MAG: helix-turn-helix domain-containing protein [Bacteroidia bacterium]|nr:helix-turn-helix domain-containing protein [Bacteroidia bacterium]
MPAVIIEEKLVQEIKTIIEITVRRAVKDAIKEEMAKQNPKILTQKQAAEMLGIGYYSLQKLIKQGKIKTVANKKISYAEIIRFINQTNYENENPLQNRD